MPSQPHFQESSIGLKLRGALSSVLKTSEVTKNDLIDEFTTAHIVPADTYSKQTVVQTGFASADDTASKRIAEGLIKRLKNDGLFASNQDSKLEDVAKLKAAFTSVGAVLDDSGQVQWSQGQVQTNSSSELAAEVPAHSASAPFPHPPATTNQHVSAAPLSSPTDQGPETTVQEVVKLLRRVPFAAKSLTVNRRKNRPLVAVADEYDAQDFIFMALRLLFDDVVDEQPTGKTGGDGSNRGDFYLSEHKIMIEAKVAKKNHGTKLIKDEIAADQASYRDNDSVKALVVVIYDLDNVIDDRRMLVKHLDGDAKTTSVVVRWDRPLVVPMIQPKESVAPTPPD